MNPVDEPTFNDDVVSVPTFDISHDPIFRGRVKYITDPDILMYPVIFVDDTETILISVTPPSLTCICELLLINDVVILSTRPVIDAFVKSTVPFMIKFVVLISPLITLWLNNEMYDI